jgi:Glycosyltransferase family 87
MFNVGNRTAGRRTEHSGPQWRFGLSTPVLFAAVAFLVVRFANDFMHHRTAVGDVFSDGAAHGSIMADLRDALYLPAHYLWNGGNPWNPDQYAPAYPQAADFGLYSPVNFLIFGPILALPWTAAGIAWVLLVEVPVLTVLVVFTWRLIGAPRRVDVVLLLVLAGLLWQPMLAVLKLGNPSVVTATAVAIAAWPRTSARGLSVATTMMWLKPHFGLGSVTNLAARRISPVVKGLLASAVLGLPAVVLAAYHAGGPIAFLRSVPRNFGNSAKSPWGGDPLLPGRYDLVSLASRITGERLPVAAQAVVVAAVLTLGALAYIGWLRTGQHALALATAVLTVLLTIHQNVDDFAAGFVVVIALVVMVWRDRVNRPEVVREPAWLAACAVAVLLAIVGFRLPSIERLIGLSWVQGRNLDECLALASWLICVSAAALSRVARATAGDERTITPPNSVAINA